MFSLNIYSITLISTAVFILLIATILYVYFIQSNKKFKWSKNGNIIIKVDGHSRKMTPYLLDGNNLEIEKNPQFTGKKVDNLLTQYLENVFALWKNTDGEEKYMNVIMRSFNSQEKHVSETFRINKMKINKETVMANFTISMDKIQEQDDYILSISWHSINPEHLEIDKQEAQIEKIIMRNELYKGFIALEINHNIDNAFKNLTNIIFQNRFDDYDYIYLSNILIIVCYQNTLVDVKKKTKFFINYLQELNKKRAINMYINGSGYSYFQGVDSQRDFHRAFATLAFLTNKSIREGAQYIKLRSDAKSNEEFEQFNEATKIFRENINENKYEILLSSVIEANSKRELIKIASPHIKGVPEAIIAQILSSKYYRRKFYDSFVAYAIEKDSKFTVPTIISVEASWMLLNYDKFKNTNLVPSFSFRKLENLDSIKLIVKYLHALDFKTALRLKTFDDFTVPQIEATNPSFIIIDKSFAGQDVLKSIVYAKLVTLNEICKKKDILLIYEDVPQTNEEVSKMIGLKYVYTANKNDLLNRK